MKHNTYQKAELVLEDGSRFEGYSFGYEQPVAGELVFNTAMTGYPESLTDPSYCGQILVLTYPSVGNYGVPFKTMENGMLQNFESEKVQITALVISDYSEEYNHWNASESLGDWLKFHKVPGIFGIDTRALTKRIREHGAMLAKVEHKRTNTDFFDPNKTNLVAQVSTKEIITYGSGKYRIMLVDCGVKYNIIRHLLKRDTTIVRVPWDYNYHQEEFDGLFITNGPGNPKMCGVTIEHIRKSLAGNKPMFGICLGNQLMALASGADTYKLKYGHRSHNQPVLEVGTNKAYLTSQNHGFAVDNKTLSDEWVPYFVNLNDQTNEGMKHSFKPFFSTQFHPEASGGPTDTDFLFDDFIRNIEMAKQEVKA